MGCAACKAPLADSVSPCDSRNRQNIEPELSSQRESVSVDGNPKVALNGGPIVNGSSILSVSQQKGASSPPTVSLTASGSSTAPSPHTQASKKDPGVTLVVTAAAIPENDDHSSKEESKLVPSPNTLLAPPPKPISSQLTLDSSSATEGTNSPKGSTASKLSAEKQASQRDLSSCRLKKCQNIADAYEISASRVLGTGISGAVRLAKHKVSGRQFAIKTLSLESVGAKKAAMLHNEVSIYLKLDHPNIARLIEVYETEKNIHLVMELCTGGELYDRLATKKKYREADAANVARQMLAAINYCHQHRICHRDLKLENWVYADKSEDAPLKLIDFGFSRIFNPGVPMTAMHGTVYYVSPEVMDGCYQEKCDIWSIGVIVYMLLSGSPPFNGSYDHEILVKIKRGHFTFSGPRWQGISDQAKQFITYLLQKDPDARPSAEDALKHPWLLQADSESNNIDLEVVKSMRDFALGNVLRRAAMAVVALAMTSREVEELEKAFKALDRNNRGTIQLQDLANALKEKLNIDSAEAQRIFERIDQTGSREVHYSEFIASTLQAKIIKNDSLIKEAFQHFDLDKNQAISLENLRAVIGDTYDGSRVEEIMQLCDSNGDGKIDFDEFYRALTSDEAALADTRSDICQKQELYSDFGPLESPPDSTTYPSARVSNSSQNTTATGRLRPPPTCEAAFTALQSMRKATCLSAVAEAERRCGSLWDTFVPQTSTGVVFPPSD